MGMEVANVNGVEHGQERALLLFRMTDLHDQRRVFAEAENLRCMQAAQMLIARRCDAFHDRLSSLSVHEGVSLNISARYFECAPSIGTPQASALIGKAIACGSAYRDAAYPPVAIAKNTGASGEC
jgi:hypothetical protein